MAVAADEPLVGYLAHLRKDSAFVGALLNVTPDGDPVDFVYTDPLEVTALQGHLLGRRLEPWALGHVLPTSLLAASPSRPAAVLFDSPAVLLRRSRLGVPALVIAPADAPRRAAWWDRAAPVDGLHLWRSAGAPDTAVAAVRLAAARLGPGGLLDPFARVRAVLEAGAGRAA